MRIVKQINFHASFLPWFPLSIFYRSNRRERSCGSLGHGRGDHCGGEGVHLLRGRSLWPSQDDVRRAGTQQRSSVGRARKWKARKRLGERELSGVLGLWGH